MSYLNLQIAKWVSRAGLAIATALFVFFLMGVHDCHGQIGGGIQQVCEFFAPGSSINAYLTVRMFQAVFYSCILFAGACLGLRLLRTFTRRGNQLAR